MADVSTANTPVYTDPVDHQRPRYHVVAPANWINDPNGLIQKNGTYHLFYQHNPFGSVFGLKHWGHVSSTDLVHWQHHPIALAPVPDSPDQAGVFSGCAVDRGDDVLLMYTGVSVLSLEPGHQLPCVATSLDPELDTWERHPDNPVIPELPAELDLEIFRDHTIWKEGDSWLMGIGAAIRDVGGAVIAYRSTDLIHWEYLHPLVVGEIDPDDPMQGGTGWECPDFFPLGDDHVLMISGWDGNPINVIWMTGDYADVRFTPTKRDLVDAGPSFYAPQSFTDEAGRRVMIGWLRERRTSRAAVAAGWAGTMTLPRLLSLDADGTLLSAPAPENDLLRERALVATIDPDGHTDLTGDTLELLATFRAGASEPVGLVVRANPDGSEETRIVWHNGTLSLDTRRASTDSAASGALSTQAVAIDAAEAITLRVYLDRSVIEVFVNDRICISDRIYPADAASEGVSVIGSSELESLQAWEMGSAFANA